MTLNGIQNEARYSRNLSILMSSRVQSNLLVLFASLLCIISHQPLPEKSPDMKFFSGPCFLVFVLNTEMYYINHHIQSEYGKIHTRKNFKLGHFSRSELF